MTIIEYNFFYNFNLNVQLVIMKLYPNLMKTFQNVIDILLIDCKLVFKIYNLYVHCLKIYIFHLKDWGKVHVVSLKSKISSRFIDIKNYCTKWYWNNNFKFGITKDCFGIIYYQLICKI